MQNTFHNIIYKLKLNQVVNMGVEITWFETRFGRENISTRANDICPDTTRVR